MCLSCTTGKGFPWKGDLYRFDGFFHVRSTTILGRGSESSIELVYRTTEGQKRELMSAVLHRNTEKIDALMSQIVLHPAAHRRNMSCGDDAWISEFQCVTKMKEKPSPHYPEILEIKLVTEGRKSGVGFDMTCFREGTLFDKIVSSADKITLLPYGWSAVEATSHLHTLEFIHRDIKPENFMIRSEGRGVAIIDFGLGAWKNSKSFTDICGSPGYMAPERFEGHFSEASDTFSLGMVLYHILSFADSGVDPRSCLISRMLQKEPSQRPSLVEVRSDWERMMRLDYGFVSIGPMWFSLATI